MGNARIQSSIGESNFQSRSGQNFVVEDETLSQGRAQIPPENSEVQSVNPYAVAGMRKQAMERQEEVEHRALNDARRRIDVITGLGRKTREVPIDTDDGKLVFTLRTLKTFEQNCLAEVVESVDRIKMPDGRISFTQTGMHKIKLEALSHSMFLIDGKSVDVVLGTSNLDYKDQVMSRKELVSEMDGALIDFLFINYEELSKEAYDGYAPKNADEAKEVVETIRKSGENA